MSYKKNDSYEVPVTEQIAVHVKEILRLRRRRTRGLLGEGLLQYRP